MIRNLLIKIFIFIFTLTNVAAFFPLKPALASSDKTYAIPIKLSTFSNLSRALPSNLSLIKTAIVKENSDKSIITLSFETKEKNHSSNYILDIKIYDNNQLKTGKVFYRYFDEKSKTYIHQVQFERKSKKENQIKVNLLTNNSDYSTSYIVIELDWQKAKSLNTKKFNTTTKDLVSKSPRINLKERQTSNKVGNTSKQNLTNSSTPISNANPALPQQKQTGNLADTNLNSALTNPARMQDYINYYNNIKSGLHHPSPLVTSTSLSPKPTKIQETPEDILEDKEKGESDKKEVAPLLRSVSDFFNSDSYTKEKGSYTIDISALHLNPLTGKLADENSKDTDLIKILSKNIISPSLETGINLKEILRQEPDSQEKKWARAGLERKGDKLYAKVRLHLANHIRRSPEDGPFFKVLKENGQYELVTATESNLTINKEGDSYADYTFEVPRENFSAMVQVNIEVLNKTINFFLEVNPRTIKKGSLSGNDISQAQPASPLLKTIFLGLVLLSLVAIPLLAIKRKRQLEEDEYEDYDDEDEEY